MNYYSFHVGDYRRDTTHLTCEEHYIYRTLIDWYFLDEEPIPLETQTVSRRLLIKPKWLPYLNNVLEEFFEKTEKGWVHHRIEEDISVYLRKCKHNKMVGKLGGRPKKTHVVSKNNQTLTKVNPNQEPITNNHKPISKESTKEKATRLPKDFTLPLEWKNWFFEKRPKSNIEELKEIFDKFKDYWISKPGKDGTKLNWLATWRNWVRNEKEFSPKKTGKYDPLSYFKNEGEKENDSPKEKTVTGEVVSSD